MKQAFYNGSHIYIKFSHSFTSSVVVPCLLALGHHHPDNHTMYTMQLILNLLPQTTTLITLAVQVHRIKLFSNIDRCMDVNICFVSPPQSTMVPSSITFNWRRCKDRPLGMSVNGQPVALNGKVYVRGDIRGSETVLEYTPGHDKWAELPPPSVQGFTIVTLRGELLVVGGMDDSTNKTTNTIHTFDEHSQRWIQSHPAMPTALTYPAVIVYQDHLIVAGGRNSDDDAIPDVSILDTTSNKWKTAQSLSSTSHYCTVLIEDNIYLEGVDVRTVLQAHVPTLISGAKSGGWETLPNTPYYWSIPVTIGNTLLTVGGWDTSQGVTSPTTSIQMYNPTTYQWTRVGDLPKPMDKAYCTIMNSELFVLGDLIFSSVYVSKLSGQY